MTVDSGYRYSAYGLAIESTFEIPEMLPAVEPPKAEPDVVIRRGEVPTELDGPIGRGVASQSTADEMLLTIEDVGRYLVSKGCRITVDPDEVASDHDVRVFLLGTCLGALLHQRGAFVLHASGIGTPEGAVLFAGHSGAGKSTLLAELMRRGHKMMVDDVSAITPDADNGGRLVVMPSYPRTRLWSDAAAHFDIDTSNLHQTRSHMDKFERQLPDQFWDRPAPLRKIYCLGAWSRDYPDLAPIEAMHVVPLMVENTYRQLFLDPFGMRERHFGMLSEIARNVPVSWAIRPTDSFRVSELADMVLADLEE